MKFYINTFDYQSSNYSEWILPFDYHCLYLIENGNEIYIGETKNVIERTKNHKTKKNDPCYGRNLLRIHIVQCREFEEPPAKQYEAQLINLIRADGKFKILNKKKNEWQVYERKNLFELGFDELWLKLEEMGLVNHKSFYDVINLSEFKYSPFTALTKLQRETLNSIINAVNSGELSLNRDNKNRPILIEGDAGTGKTVVALSLLHYLKTNDRYKNLKIGLVYPITNTRYEIQNIVKTVPGLKKKDIIPPVDVTKSFYDIIICDEAQRLRCVKNIGKYYRHFKNGNERLGFDINNDELDWLLKNSAVQVFFYDKRQNVTPSDIPYESFMQRLKSRDLGIRPVALKEQMRIKAGEGYVDYIYDILNENATEVMHFEGYDFRLFKSFDDMCSQLREREREFGLSRSAAGYAWEWVSNGTDEKADICIENEAINWNSEIKGWLHKAELKNEMGSIYTLHGFDLNYAAVVIGPELYYDKSEGCIRIDREHFYDNKVSKDTTDEELKKYIINTYGVLLSRGIMGTYIYACDSELRKYFEKYIPIYKGGDAD